MPASPVRSPAFRRPTRGGPRKRGTTSGDVGKGPPRFFGRLGEPALPCLAGKGVLSLLQHGQGVPVPAAAPAPPAALQAASPRSHAPAPSAAGQDFRPRRSSRAAPNHPAHAAPEIHAPAARPGAR